MSYTDILSSIHDEGEAFTETFLSAHANTKLPNPLDFFSDDEKIYEKYKTAIKEFNEGFFRANLRDMAPTIAASAIIREVDRQPMQEILGTHFI